MYLNAKEMTTNELGYHSSNVQLVINKGVDVMLTVGNQTRINSYPAGELSNIMALYNEVQLSSQGISKIKYNKAMNLLELHGFSAIACNWRDQEDEVYSFNLIFGK